MPLKLITPRRAFQFTHPRGVRHIRLRCIDATTTFQFTHPRGVRRRIKIEEAKANLVSIHAPTRGATTPRPTSATALRLFQFTHPRGVRQDGAPGRDGVDGFQFTHPRGVRPLYN